MSHFQPESFGAGSQGNFNQSFGSPAQSQGAFGGGFIQGSPGSNFGGSPVPFTQSTQQRKRDSQSLLPVTIKQLNDAAPGAANKEARLKIDGKQLAQITLVGVILQVDFQSTNVTYMIDDGTGKLNVKVYIDSEDENSSKHAQYRVNTYVRVIGNYRVFNSVVSVIGFQLIPVNDFNEITFHILQVISCHLKNTKGANAASQQQGTPTGAAIGNNMNFSSSSPAPGLNRGNFIPNSGPMQQGCGELPGFSDVQKQVMGVFSNDRSDTGVHIDNVCQHLPHIPRPEIMKAIEFMSDEGHLYSTVDENHFKSTDADT